MGMEDNAWHLDKRVPLALIVVIALQSAAFAYGYGQLSQRVEDNSDDITAINTVIPRLVRLETLMEGVHSTLQEIKVDLRTYNDQRRER